MITFGQCSKCFLQGFQNWFLCVERYFLSRFQKKNVFFLSLHQFQRKINLLQAKRFWRSCQNGILHAQRIYLKEKEISSKKLKVFLSTSDFQRTNLELWWRNISRIVKTDFYDIKKVLKDKFNSKKTLSIVSELPAKTFGLLARQFCRDCQNCNLPFRTTLLGKRKKFFENTSYFICFGLSAKSFRSFGHLFSVGYSKPFLNDQTKYSVDFLWKKYFHHLITLMGELFHF